MPHPLCSQCDLKKTVLSYLDRERFRASTAALVAEHGSIAQREAAARAHEVNNAMTVIEGIFTSMEKSFAATTEVADKEEKDGEIRSKALPE